MRVHNANTNFKKINHEAESNFQIGFRPHNFFISYTLFKVRPDYACRHLLDIMRVLGAILMNKIKQWINSFFEMVGPKVMKIIFVTVFILAVLFIGMATVIPELNHKTYQGIVVEKYKENHGLTTGTSRFIVLKHGKETIKIQNDDILLHGKFNSQSIQEDIIEGKKAEIKTIGFNFPRIGFYPNLYQIKQ